MRAITHCEIAKVRNWPGRLRTNRPVRKDIVRNLAQAHRDIHAAEWPQKTKRKFSRERFSLRIRVKGCSHFLQEQGLSRQVEFVCGICASQIWRVHPVRGEDALSLPTAADANDADHGSISL